MIRERTLKRTAGENVAHHAVNEDHFDEEIRKAVQAHYQRRVQVLGRRSDDWLTAWQAKNEL